jgi:hypothetical protein
MVFRVILGAILGAAALMGWGAAFWIALPFGGQVLHPLPEDDKIVGELKEANLESGVYISPPMQNAKASPDERMAQNEKYKAGPLIYVTYRKEGVDLMDQARIYGVGFAHFVLCTLAAGFLLAAAAPTLRTYSGRVFFVFLLGVFGAVAFDLSPVVWFHQPWGFPALMAGFHLVGWLLAGILMGAVIRAPRERTA